MRNSYIYLYAIILEIISSKNQYLRKGKEVYNKNWERFRKVLSIVKDAAKSLGGQKGQWQGNTFGNMQRETRKGKGTRRIRTKVQTEVG